MEQFSPTQIHGFNAVLSADIRLPPPSELSEVPVEQLDDDYPLQPALDKHVALLQENAVLEKAKTSLRQELDASQKEIKSLRLQLDASQKEKKAYGEKLSAALHENKTLVRKVDASRIENKSRGQKLTAARKANKSIRQELDASERRSASLGQMLSAFQSEHCKESKSLGHELAASQIELNMRQLLQEFRQKDMGKELDKDLMKKARKSFHADFKDELVDRFGNPVYTFSRTVIHLATESMSLLKEKNDYNLSPDRLSEIESEIKSIEAKLGRLKAVATSFQKPEMKWDGNTIGEGFYFWCLYVADVNKACHRDMTKESLDDMYKRAARGEYTHEGVKLGPAIKAAIQQMRLRTVSSLGPRKGCPPGYMFLDKEAGGPIELADDSGILPMGLTFADDVLPNQLVDATVNDLLLSASDKEESVAAASNGSHYSGLDLAGFESLSTAPRSQWPSVSSSTAQATTTSAAAATSLLDIEDLLGLNKSM